MINLKKILDEFDQYDIEYGLFDDLSSNIILSNGNSFKVGYLFDSNELHLWNPLLKLFNDDMSKREKEEFIKYFENRFKIKIDSVL